MCRQRNFQELSWSLGQQPNIVVVAQDCVFWSCLSWPSPVRAVWLSWARQLPELTLCVIAAAAVLAKRGGKVCRERREGWWQLKLVSAAKHRTARGVRKHNGLQRS